MRPGQEWGPFPLEILDALDFPRSREEKEEPDGAKLTGGEGPQGAGASGWAATPWK